MYDSVRRARIARRVFRADTSAGVALQGSFRDQHGAHGGFDPSFYPRGSRSLRERRINSRPTITFKVEGRAAARKIRPRVTHRRIREDTLHRRQNAQTRDQRC